MCFLEFFMFLRYTLYNKLIYFKGWHVKIFVIYLSFLKNCFVRFQFFFPLNCFSIVLSFYNLPYSFYRCVFFFFFNKCVAKKEKCIFIRFFSCFYRFLSKLFRKNLIFLYYPVCCQSNATVLLWTTTWKQIDFLPSCAFEAIFLKI